MKYVKYHKNRQIEFTRDIDVTEALLDALQTINVNEPERKQIKQVYDSFDAKLDAIAKHPEVDNFKHLTMSKLIADLEYCKHEVKTGYFMSTDGSAYVHGKGIEIDGSCDLGRSGFNGEDIGVFVHFVEVTSRSICEYDVPVCQFWSMQSEYSGDKRLVTSDKQAFDAAVQRAQAAILADYAPAVPIDKQVKLIEKWLGAHVIATAKIRSIIEAYKARIAKQ